MQGLIEFSCIALGALDFNTIRVDKTTQVTIHGMAAWPAGVGKYTVELGKNDKHLLQKPSMRSPGI